MLRLYTIPEKRFAYRRESVASSIAPVNAALTVELARPYLKEEAQVLDPFCGVGTMLMERNYAVHAGTMYGIDLYGDAIEKARINTAYAGCRIHYINKDFFAFHHEYLFDEIITDMPQVTASRPAGEIRDLYLRFFVCAGDCLKDEAILVLYATEPDFVLQGVRRNPEYRILRRHEINEKNHTTVFVIRRTATCGTNTEKNEKIYR
jgi:tRNA G10  N-methylase Trm11